MKKIIAALLVLCAAHTVWAQSDKMPHMTTAFSDSLKKQIINIVPPDYSIKLSYRSTISNDGRLLKPLIRREIADGDINYNDFLQTLRTLIKNAPPWQLATASSNTIVQMVSFDIEIKNGQVSITDKNQ